MNVDQPMNFSSVHLGKPSKKKQQKQKENGVGRNLWGNVVDRERST